MPSFQLRARRSDSLSSYALVLSDNHIYTSGATGTHAAAIRGALRAENPELLTVILPQTVGRQPREIRELIGQVQNVVELGHDQLPLDAASRICNSELLSKGDQLIVFAFHDSKTLRETIEEAKAMLRRADEQEKGTKSKTTKMGDVEKLLKLLQARRRIPTFYKQAPNDLDAYFNDIEAAMDSLKQTLDGIDQEREKKEKAKLEIKQNVGPSWQSLEPVLKRFGSKLSS